MDFPTSEFWNYSTQIWTLPEVESICLDMQNHFDANVNILLYCCWVGDKKLTLSDDDLQMLLDTVQPWQTMIKPLRDSRKMMQQHLIAMPSELIDQTVGNMNEMELNAEHMAQLAMEKVLNTDKMSACSADSELECSLQNINTYIKSMENLSSTEGLMPQISQLLSQLLTAIYQDEEGVQLALMNSASSA